MTNLLFPSIKKIALEPGVLFPVANIFVFAQSGNRVALGLSVLNVALAIFFALGQRPPVSPLRLTAYMALLSGFFSFGSGAWLAGCAGLIFGAGNFLASSATNMAALHDAAAHPCHKVVTHPAVYYGLGYCMTGLMAGGGLSLLAHPLDHVQPFIMVGIGAVTIILASLGLALNFLKAATPFWILACGTGINTVAGIVAGNFVGAGSPFFAMLGELRLGWLAQKD